MKSGLESTFRSVQKLLLILLKICPYTFCKINRKTFAMESFGGLETKRLHCNYFPVNFAKIVLRTDSL